MSKITLKKLIFGILITGGIIFSGFFVLGFAKEGFDQKEDKNIEGVENQVIKKVSQDFEPKKFKFAVLGDTQNFKSKDEDGDFQLAVDLIKKEKNVDFIVTVGDMLSSCDGGSECKEKIKKWKKVLGKDLLEKTFITIGNHDRSGDGKADRRWQKDFEMPKNGPEGFEELVYSFDFGNSHFIVLNSQKPKDHVINESQRRWLVDDLVKNQRPNVFVFVHEPAFPISGNKDDSLDAKPEERDALWEILARHKVTAVFSGHEHLHSRRIIDGVHQFIVGNTDANGHKEPSKKKQKKYGVDYVFDDNSFVFVNVDDQKITVEVVAIEEGEIVDTYTFE